MSELKPNESVLFFPSVGHLVDGGETWRIAVSGVVLRPGRVGLRKRFLLRLLRRALKMPPGAIETDLFRRRISGFLVGTKGKRQVSVRIGGQNYALQKSSKRNGQFAGVLHVDRREVARLQRSHGHSDGWLAFELARPDGRPVYGRAHLIGETGVTVVSDIDDTMKHTGTTSHRALLASTFLREFEPIDGMPDLYRRWAEQGVAFHYVSSSPWQLYHSLAELCGDDGFPPGTFHLRAFRLRDDMLLRMLMMRRRGKRKTIKHILRAFPGRRFVLVGDTAERDPELYGALARRFPDRVAAIYLRNVRERRSKPERLHKALRGVPPDVWQVFDRADELPEQLPTGQSALDPAVGT